MPLLQSPAKLDLTERDRIGLFLESDHDRTMTFVAAAEIGEDIDLNRYGARRSGSAAANRLDRIFPVHGPADEILVRTIAGRWARNESTGPCAVVVPAGLFARRLGHPKAHRGVIGVPPPLSNNPPKSVKRYPPGILRACKKLFRPASPPKSAARALEFVTIGAIATETRHFFGHSMPYKIGWIERRAVPARRRLSAVAQ
jgi:hypothetical protein